MAAKCLSVDARCDQAAIFACALSFWNACRELAASGTRSNPAEYFGGGDCLMREAMEIGRGFEGWACNNVDFSVFDEVWPYLLEEEFGAACLTCFLRDPLSELDDNDYLWIALHLRLPIVFSDELSIPVNLFAPIPRFGFGFRGFRIQTVRNPIGSDDIVPFVMGDDPGDEGFGKRYFAVYGLGSDGILEHIADRSTYQGAFNLAEKLSPGIEFPAAANLGRLFDRFSPPGRSAKNYAGRAVTNGVTANGGES